MFTPPLLRRVAISFPLVAACACSSTAPEVAPEPPTAGPILEGRIVDLDGMPVPDVEVNLAGGFATRWWVGGTTTDEDGVYRFAPLDVGSMIEGDDGRWDYFVGMQLGHPLLVSADGGWWWDVRVPNVDGQVTRQDFCMCPAGTLTGVVRNDEGAPRGVALRFHGVGHDHFRWASADAEGRFTEAGLFPGTYKIDVNSPGFDYPVIGTAEVVAGESTHVERVFSR